MSKNIKQVYDANPITTNAPTDLMYFGQSPYNGTDDAAMRYSDFAAQFSSIGATPVEVQQFAFNNAIAGGANDAFVVNLSPVVTSLTNGLIVTFETSFTNLTTSPTIAVNALTPVPIVLSGGDSLAPGDIQPSTSYIAIYNAGTNEFQLVNPFFSSANTFFTQANEYNFGTGSGIANAYTLTLNPAPPVTISGGFPLLMSIPSLNTGATTIALNGGSTIPIVALDGSPLVGGELTANSVAYMLYNTNINSFVLQNSAISAGGGVTPTQVQQAVFNTGADTGVADAYVVALTPVVSAYTNGLIVCFTVANTNTTISPTLDAGAGPIQIYLLDFGTLLPGDLIASGVSYCVYLDGAFCILNPIASYVSAFGLQSNITITGTDTGTANAYVYTNTAYPPITFTAGQFLILNNPLNTNSGSSTLDGIAINTPDGSSLLGGEIVGGVNRSYLFLANATGNYTLMNSSGSSAAATPTQVQQSAFNTGIDTGIADAYVVALSPAVVNLVNGLEVSFTPVHNNTTTSPTLDVQGGSPQAIVLSNGAISAGDFNSSIIAKLIYDTAIGSFILLNPVTSLVTPLQIETGYYLLGTDSGTANNYNIADYAGIARPNAGQLTTFIPLNTNTGASTLQFNSFSMFAAPIVLENGSALTGGEIIAGQVAYVLVIGAGGPYQLLNPAKISSFITSPVASQDSTLAIGTAYQNTLGYDVVLTVYVEISSAAGADFLLGVGPTSSPTQQTIISGFTLATVSVIPITIYLPNNYYALLSTSGSISDSISGQQVMPV